VVRNGGVTVIGQPEMACSGIANVFGNLPQSAWRGSGGIFQLIAKRGVAAAGRQWGFSGRRKGYKGNLVRPYVLRNRA